jgi:hypothetical protein
LITVSKIYVSIHGMQIHVYGVYQGRSADSRRMDFVDELNVRIGPSPIPKGPSLWLSILRHAGTEITSRNRQV